MALDGADGEPGIDPGALALGLSKRRFWPVAKYVLSIGVLGVALWVLSSHTDELSGIPRVIENLDWWWVPPAVVAEVASFACLAMLQLKLLQRGGLGAPQLPLFKMSVAGQALADSLPAGTAVSSVYSFRWFRRFGADDTLAAWAMVGTVIASMVSLSLVATLGLALAAGQGASLDLIPVLIGVLVIAVSVSVLFVHERPLFLVLSWGIRTSQRLIHRPRGDGLAAVDELVSRITSVDLNWRQFGTIVLWASANWLFDCACFAMMFLAVDSTIPWKGLLLAYGAGQLAAALPVTPGGLGAVEGSITIALVAFGGAHVTTVDAVLMYRLISFWLVLLVGWVLWGELAHEVRAGRWARVTLAAPVDAELGPVDAGPTGLSPSETVGAVATAGSTDRPDTSAPGPGPSSVTGP
jgi:uncharacterized protein (TIRG00374 family)